jgi:acylphosphatase
MAPPPDAAAARWLVSGRVQGVGFRWFVLRQAESLGVVGWTRNLPDGRVEVVARGRSIALDQLDRHLRTGPRFARVDSVEKLDIPHEDVDYKSFQVK